MTGLSLAFLMPSDDERRVLRHLQAEIHGLQPHQIEHVGHLLRSWRVQQGMYWDQAVRCIRKAIRRARNDRP